MVSLRSASAARRCCSSRAFVCPQLVCFGLVARDELVLARLRLHQRRLEGPHRRLQGLGVAGVLGRGVRKRVTRRLLVAVTIGEQRLLPFVRLVKRGLRHGDSRELLGERPLEPLLRRLEVGGELGLVRGMLRGGDIAPLLGFLERGFECREPGWLMANEGPRRPRVAPRQGRGQLFPLGRERRGLLFPMRRGLRQGAFEPTVPRDVPEDAQRRRERVGDAPQRDRVDLQRVAQAAEPRQIDLGRPPVAGDHPREKGPALIPCSGATSASTDVSSTSSSSAAPNIDSAASLTARNLPSGRDARQAPRLPLDDSAQVGFARAFHVGVG